MLGRSGYRALPLGDFDRFQQSSFGFLGSQKGCLSPERGGVGPGADAPQSWPSYLCHGLISFLGFLLLLITFPVSGWFALKIVPTYERMIVFRLGRIRTPQGPGMVLLLPFIDSFQRVDLRTRAFNVPPCKLASKDGAVLSVGADVQFRIWDPVLSVMTVKDLNTATRMTAQNAMTKALLKRPLREIQMEKLKISDQLLDRTKGRRDLGTFFLPLLHVPLQSSVHTAARRIFPTTGNQRCDQGLGAGGGPSGTGSGGCAPATPGQPSGVQPRQHPPAAGPPLPGRRPVLGGRRCPTPRASGHLGDGERSRAACPSRRRRAQPEAACGRGAADGPAALPFGGPGQPGWGLLPVQRPPAQRDPEHLLPRPHYRAREGRTRGA
ncbi:stomatin-like protein 1 isoform X3 [Panthera pardus]|uniref:Stomatin-like protein 1 isoform X3 n=1 Tax=Panthera pardus TaxID=9691 RepID=A0A9W2UEK8_PANPR|nr:stomatin-like protein 1 isoform X3 [Panthera pardus]